MHHGATRTKLTPELTFPSVFERPARTAQTKRPLLRAAVRPLDAAELSKMMEDVSMQCDIYDMDQMSEEEILACLVADTEPKFTVRPFGLH